MSIQDENEFYNKEWPNFVMPRSYADYRSVRIFFDFALTYLQEIRNSYYIYVYTYLPYIFIYSLTNSYAQSSNYAHLRNARTTDTSYGNRKVQNTTLSQRCCPNVLSCAMSMFLPAWLGGCQVVNENESVVNLVWGELSSVITTPGIYCVNPCGIQTFRQSLKQVSLDLNKIKVIDKKEILCFSVRSWCTAFTIPWRHRSKCRMS